MPEDRKSTVHPAVDTTCFSGPASVDNRARSSERTLLLVDDESNIVASLARLLRRDGYRILRANSGKEGLEILEQEKVGVILSDQRMPEMTGVEFLSQVRERHPETVRLVLSGYTDLNSITDAINRGAVYKFLTKPWDDDLLRTNIAEAFEYFEMKQENRRLTEELRASNEELARFNLELERRVEEKARESLQSLHALRIAQAVLAQLPIAVLGLDEEGLIVVANQQADNLLAGEGTTLIGLPAEHVLPVELQEAYQTFVREGVGENGYINIQGREYRLCLAPLAGTACGTIMVMQSRSRI